MKTLIFATCVLAFSGYTTSASKSDDLGLLSDYYYDCPAKNGPRAAYVRKVVNRALAGDYAAMRLVIMHRGLFSTGDNEAYSGVPGALLRTLGDDRYAAFVISQPRDIQQAALAVYPEQGSSFVHKFPKTSKLYHEQFSRGH